MGEPQGAEDNLRGESGEEADEDKAGEQDEGQGKHCCLEQELIQPRISTTRKKWRKERHGKSNETVLQRTIVTSAEVEGDSTANDQMDGQGDEGVELEKSNNKGHCRRPP